MSDEKSGAESREPDEAPEQETSEARASEQEASAEVTAESSGETPEEAPEEAADEQPAAENRAAARGGATDERPGATSRRTTVLTVVSTVAVIAVLAGLIAGGVLLVQRTGELDDIKREQADRAHAEKVAADYAVAASTFDYRDLTPWRTEPVKNATPELKKKWEASTGAMNQLLQPLQWVSKATLLDAVEKSVSGPVRTVTVYVQVDATNVQNPEGRTVVSVYEVTMDQDKGWLISDAGGPPGLADPTEQGAAAPPAGQAPAAPEAGIPAAPEPAAPAPR
ncbi:hypothetical protein [Tsukamurella sp. 1534]|uniref:hypothetical protein n=1 Tax=Tsukamurella sp. 1534 TaxID=1151061 RepID=UPI0003045A88|nr:hypothetical protein [Tsukamurella sp. 1534]